MRPAARVGDATSHSGIVVPPCVPTVLIGGRPAAVQGCVTQCPSNHRGHPAPDGTIMAGSATVLIGGRPAARRGERLTCGAVIASGCTTVLIGG